MDLTLERLQFRPDGIFGELRDDSDGLVAVTLEHSYRALTGEWLAKIPEGFFTCVRGEHHLHGMKNPFTTFEVTGVAGHAGLLFHWGNLNRDSEGCILLGDQVSAGAGAQGTEMILNSRVTFKKFMELQARISSFQLMVIDLADSVYSPAA